MAESAMAPDIQHKDTHSNSKTCVQLAQDKVDEYAATLHFLGLLGGVVGTPKERQEARDAALEALRHFLGPTSLREATQREEETQRQLENAQHALNWARTGRSSPDEMMRLTEAKDLAQKSFDTAYADRTELLHQSLVEVKEKIWNFFKSTYNKVMELIKGENWKLALCEISIDTGFFILENAVMALVSAAGFGAAAAVFKVIGKITEEGSRVVKISLRAVRKTLGKEIAHELERSATDVEFKREIHVLKDLEGAERKMLGEEGQGNLHPDKKAGSPQGHPEPLPEKKIPCFNKPKKVDAAEFLRQLKEQEATIRKHTADELGYGHAVLDQARHKWREDGKKKGSFTNLLRDKNAQQRARDALEDNLRSIGKSDAEIEKFMKTINATHELDMIAGGSPSAITAGGAAANQAAGSGWIRPSEGGVSPVDALRSEVQRMRSLGLNNQTLDHIRLNPC